MLPELRSTPLTCVLVVALAGGCAKGVTSFGDDYNPSSSGGGGTPVCQPAESCGNGIDDDCDGVVDNGCSCADGQQQSCYSGPGGTQGVGVCQDGLQSCTASTWGPCDGQITPLPESCDGLDNDCDGAIDEDSGCSCADGQQQSCYSGPSATQGVGVCQDGLQSCTADTWGPCEGQVTPLPESCDGLDNDCDGAVDNGNPGGGAVCVTGQPGPCADGTLICTGGAVVCTPTVQPSAEICDGLDNDCNGAVDDIGGPCSTGLPGVCADGTNQCQGSTMICTQNVQASAEICNDGLDNDCNGAIDNGCSSGCAHDICTSGAALTSGCDPCVTQICAVDSFCCTTSWDSACVGEVASVCGSSQCGGSSCAHDICLTGMALTSGCDPCVTLVCSYDYFCCDTLWDDICVDEVTSLCGQYCP